MQIDLQGLSIFFSVLTLITIVLFYYATSKNKIVLGITLGVMVLQGGLANANFYLDEPYMLTPSTSLNVSSLYYLNTDFLFH